MVEKDIRSTEKYYAIQKKEWMAFRVFWIVMAFVLVAAAFGLFGNGLISKQTYTTSSVKIDYNKFMRVDKEVQLYIRIQDLGAGAAIGINNDYLKKVRIEQVIPEPASVAVRDNTLIYRFNSLRNGFITFYLTPQLMGSQELEITVAGKKMRFNQYIYL
jgi:hypothetical protein